MPTNSPVKGLLFHTYINVWGHPPRKPRLQIKLDFILQVCWRVAETAEV